MDKERKKQIDSHPLVVFSGSHCPPCKLLKKFLDEHRKTYLLVDVGEEGVVEEYGVTSVPTCKIKDRE